MTGLHSQLHLGLCLTLCCGNFRGGLPLGLPMFMPYPHLCGACPGPQEVHTFRTLVSVFNGAYRQAGLGYPDQTPIFVVGLPRSGSTLVEQMLSSHSQV